MDAELVQEPKPLEPGGQEADMAVLLQESMDAFSKDLGPYMLAGLGQFVVVLPVILLVVFGGYFLGLLGFFAGMVASVFTVAFGSMFGDIGIFFGTLFGTFLPLLGFLGPFLILIPLVVLISAPLNASLVRAVAAHQRGEKQLDFSSSFSTAAQDIPRVVVTALLMTAISLVALCMCYLPVLLVPLVFGFVNSLVILHKRGPLEAFVLNLKHMSGHSASHILAGVIQIVAGMFAGMLPVIGPMFALDMHVRAHRKLFGDGSDPVMT